MLFRSQRVQRDKQRCWECVRGNSASSDETCPLRHHLHYPDWKVGGFGTSESSGRTQGPDWVIRLMTHRYHHGRRPPFFRIRRFFFLVISAAQLSIPTGNSHTHIPKQGSVLIRQPGGASVEWELTVHALLKGTAVREGF